MRAHPGAGVCHLQEDVAQVPGTEIQITTEMRGDGQDLEVLGDMTMPPLRASLM
jgi:hypothetical protein